MRLLITSIFLIVVSVCHVPSSAREKKTYIVHMSKSQMPTTYDHHLQWYEASLKQVTEAEMLYTYTNAAHGYAARLTESQVEMLKSQPGILPVLLETRYELHTTRTPDEYLTPETASDVIVGVLDTGVWPESKSFDDTGMGPVPTTWHGECGTGTNFSKPSCNRKLVGARFFWQGFEAVVVSIDESRESKSPLGDDGLGTHTVSTAVGSPVEGASLFGYAPGAARGMALRVAVYKVCWTGGCFSSDILDPWITTVGAGTLDRDSLASASVGDGKTYTDVSLFRGDPLPQGQLPLVYAGMPTINPRTECNLMMVMLTYIIWCLDMIVSNRLKIGWQLFITHFLLAVSYLRNLLSPIIGLLNVMLSSVGKNAERMNRYLKWLDIKVVFGGQKLFELWLKSNDPVELVKVIGYGGFLTFVCCLGLLNHHSITGVVFLSSFGYVLWSSSSSSELPFWSRVCIVVVNDLLVAGLATAYEYRHVWMIGN